MKLLILSPFLPFPEVQGLRIKLASILRSLKQQGEHEVFLVSFKEKTESIPEKELAPLCSRFWIFNRPEISRRTYLKNLVSPEPLLVWRFFNPKVAQAVAQITREERVDVVLFESLLMAKYYKFVYPSTTLFHAYNIEARRSARMARHQPWGPKKIYLSLIAWRLQCYEQKILRKISYLLACSPEDKLALEKLVGKKQIFVLPNVIDTDFYRPAGVKRYFQRLIFLGTLWYKPNEDAAFFLLKEIFPEVKKDFPEVELEIIGEGASSRLFQLARTWKSSVKISGFVEDIRPPLASAGIMVAPLRSGSGTKLKILVALAMGLPVVASRIACEGLTVRDEQEVLLAETPAEFKQKISLLLSDDRLRQRLIQNGRNLVEKSFSFPVLATKLKEILSHVEQEIKPIQHG